MADKIDISSGQIFTDNESPVVALGVMPREAISEEVIEESGTGLFSEAVSLEESVRLGFADGTGTRPSVELKQEYKLEFL